MATKYEMTTRDLIASVVSGATFNVELATTQALFAAVIDDSGANPVIRVSGISGTSGTSGGGGSSVYNVQTVSVDTTGSTTDYIRFTASGTTLHLPVSSGGGDWIIMKNVSNGTVTILPANSDKIDGNPYKTTSSYDSFLVVDGNTGEWDII